MEEFPRTPVSKYLGKLELMQLGYTLYKQKMVPVPTSRERNALFANLMLGKPDAYHGKICRMQITPDMEEPLCLFLHYLYMSLFPEITHQAHRVRTVYDLIEMAYPNRGFYGGDLVITSFKQTFGDVKVYTFAAPVNYLYVTGSMLGKCVLFITFAVKGDITFMIGISAESEKRLQPLWSLHSNYAYYIQWLNDHRWIILTDMIKADKPSIVGP